ncbi:TadE/TadG family type IV pilus assembly protein [Nesterenkonia sp. HG001]|uniref:TadE/TadG family type IV pilus assembly protein n=1 Tax=Nesterenkonia sp. HG001 TaxID=2983207 RepID=UPI002AC58458|nr:TadE/TadG family type IV pilus assembly protein [Nesterenkonia sp. HG001]MDZ5076038.1 pilus assembly protein [Nesterenkonia sp. HG001]
MAKISKSSPCGGRVECRSLLREERGAATAEFTMVATLLVLLTLAVIQLMTFVHVRNTLIDAASSGARFGALHDRTAEDGVERTRSLIASSIAGDHAGDVTYTYVDEEEGRTLRITVRAGVPLMGIGPGLGMLEVQGRAYAFD